MTVLARVRDNRRRTLVVRGEVSDTGPVQHGWQPVRIEFADRRYAVLALWSLSPDVVVESPADVRADILERARSITATYGPGDRDPVR